MYTPGVSSMRATFGWCLEEISLLIRASCRRDYHHYYSLVN